MSESPTNLRIHVITYNVGAFSPKEDVGPLLGLDGAGTLPDIYACGFQEIGQGPVATTSAALYDDEWSYEIRVRLKEHGYYKLCTTNILGIRITIFVKEDILYEIENVECHYARTGFGGYFGNKGAVGVSMECRGKSISFINVHLAAHDHMMKRRIEDLEMIKTNLKSEARRLYLMEDQIVILFGDLNFRLDESLSLQDVSSAIQNSTIRNFLDLDQMNSIKGPGQILHKFMEADIDFDPTFKFHAGTSSYNMKKRRPAWTDRILVKTRQEEDKVTITDYKSHESYIGSDHKPVSATCTIENVHFTRPEPIEIFADEPWTIRFTIVRFIAHADFRVQENDFITVYPEGFSAFDTYIAMMNVGGEDHPHRLRDNRKQYQRRFDDVINLTAGRYQLAYIRNRYNVLGISAGFEVVNDGRRSERNLNVCAKQYWLCKASLGIGNEKAPLFFRSHHPHFRSRGV